MEELDKKIIRVFPGKIVRKDLTAQMKRGINIPTYVLEYLLGMYCSTDDESVIEMGMEKIRDILSNNYVRSDESEKIKSLIRENGEYIVIDKLSVYLDERADEYRVMFTNLEISPFKIKSEYVIDNPKLLTGGVWCLVKLAYLQIYDNMDEIPFFAEPEQTHYRRNKYDDPYSIVWLKPIQMPKLDLQEIINARKEFTTQEWLYLLLRSEGYEPTELNVKQQMHFVLRLVPLVQNNYNLVELGPRGTGKSHIYQELSPYSILMSGGQTTASNLFYNMGTRRVGLIGHWDCVAFDEVAGMSFKDKETIQILKNYMANASFARGQNPIQADASLCFEGNINSPMKYMMEQSHLFHPFPDNFQNDSAFFDRIHYYLPGWETPKLRTSMLTSQFGLITDCLAEFCHEIRRFDFTHLFDGYFALNNEFNQRDDVAVRKTFSGLAKLLFPNGEMTKEEMKFILQYAIEGRRRVKEQLKVMSGKEFQDTNLGYIDVETGEEITVKVPEKASY